MNHSFSSDQLTLDILTRSSTYREAMEWRPLEGKKAEVPGVR
ncbi:hypothetical protein [Synechococcus sp. PCC 7335]|nr:hypothetical protein [Synechococcus sp. PCC 7335]